MSSSIRLLASLIAIAAAFLCSCDRQSTVSQANRGPYQTRRQIFKTHLLRHGPSPQRYRDEQPPAGVDEVYYPSNGHQLKGWLFRPRTPAGSRPPVLVYFHGGYAFGMDDMLVCKPFADAGFVVFTPMLRGENGNPGDFEMYMGEVDDARAAIQWIAGQDGVDKGHIYTFGHSAGGVVSALLSLFDDLPVKLTGSSGGLYGPRLFVGDKKCPFDAADPHETGLRTLVGNVPDMKLPHIAYVGDKDRYQEVKAARQERPGLSPLSVTVLNGDHFSVLPESFQQYLQQVKASRQSEDAPAAR
ncbi:MAG: putative peptidase [Verrucomicrobiaceae bacterium]|nr:putative peptidase [Verrucomicrobiaceae bacterium]